MWYYNYSDDKVASLKDMKSSNWSLKSLFIKKAQKKRVVTWQLYQSSENKYFTGVEGVVWFWFDFYAASSS